MRLLIRRALAVATVDEDDRVLADADVLVDGRTIAAVGRDLQPGPEPVDETIDATGRVVIPGLVNTHHHLYQTLTRAVPRVQDAKLFDWLLDLYEIWREIGAEEVEVGAQVGLGELLLSGCTTAADHHYVFPRGVRAADGGPADLIGAQVAAARALGIRFHPTRGSMSLGRSAGGLPPDDVVQTEGEILEDCERVIAAYHDPAPLSMCRVALAPCSPFSVTADLLRRSAELARRAGGGVRLHTHLAETLDENDFCRQRVGLRPLAYMESVGWLGPDVWYAHGVHFDPAEIGRLAATRTGVAHCPTSNLRLGSGIAPVPAMLAAGVPVGLAVDGSASNDSSHLLAEARQALLVHRVGTGVEAMPARAALRLATRGGAAVLGRDDVGTIAPGMAADLAIFDLRGLDHAGALHDPVAALLFCTPRRAETVIVDGRVQVRGGRLMPLDEDALAWRANGLASRLVARAERRTGRGFLRPRGAPANERGFGSRAERGSERSP